METKIHLANGDFIIAVIDSYRRCYSFTLYSKECEVLGWCGCDCNGCLGTNNKLKSYSKEPHIYFHSFFIYREYRRKGHGKRLLDAIKTFFKIRMKYGKVLMTLRYNSIGEMSNEQLKAFYEREGFKSSTTSKASRVMCCEY